MFRYGNFHGEKGFVAGGRRKWQHENIFCCCLPAVVVKPLSLSHLYLKGMTGLEGKLVIKQQQRRRIRISA